MPFQVNAAAHYGSGEEDGNAEPPRGIECKDVAVGQEGTDDDSGAGRVHAHPVPHVGYHACALDKKAHHQYGSHEGGQVKPVAHVHATEVRDDVYKVDDIAAVLLVQVVPAPSVGLADEEGHYIRYGYAEHIHRHQHPQLELPWHHAQVGEGEQYDEAHQRVERRLEHHGECLGYESCRCHSLLILLVGMPSCSRYLATVRRATLKPFCCSISASSSSWSGRLLSSCSMISFRAWCIFLMETSSVLALACVVKNHRRGKVPYGVSTYLLLHTRDTVLRSCSVILAMSSKRMGRSRVSSPVTRYLRCNFIIACMVRMMVWRRCMMAPIKSLPRFT